MTDILERINDLNRKKQELQKESDKLNDALRAALHSDVKLLQNDLISEFGNLSILFLI